MGVWIFGSQSEGLEIANWKLEIGNRKLGIGNWKLEMGANRKTRRLGGGADYQVEHDPRGDDHEDAEQSAVAGQPRRHRQTLVRRTVQMDCGPAERVGVAAFFYRMLPPGVWIWILGIGFFFGIEKLGIWGLGVLNFEFWKRGEI